MTAGRCGIGSHFTHHATRGHQDSQCHDAEGWPRTAVPPSLSWVSHTVSLLDLPALTRETPVSLHSG
jgi:hypothetical protein